MQSDAIKVYYLLLVLCNAMLPLGFGQNSTGVLDNHLVALHQAASDCSPTGVYIEHKGRRLLAEHRQCQTAGDTRASFSRSNACCSSDLQLNGRCFSVSLFLVAWLVLCYGPLCWDTSTHTSQGTFGLRAHPGFSQGGGAIFFLCRVASRVRKINLT